MSLPSIDPANYAEQLAAKLTRFKEDFAAFDLPQPAVHASAPQHYRLRAEFRIWHHRDENGQELLDYAMFNPLNPKEPVLMADFPVACESICTLMPRLRNAAIANETLSKRLFSIDFLATLSGDMLVTMIYHKKLDEAWEAAARQVSSELNIRIIGRSRGQKVTLENDWVQEEFEMAGRQLRYRQLEGSFSQPNGKVNRQMLAWACAQAAGIGGDLLELYCGNGNFTVALAPLFTKVLATEMAKSSVQAAHINLADNGISNTAMVRMSSDEISAALAGREVFTRLKDIDLASYQFTTLFLDPRAAASTRPPSNSRAASTTSSTSPATRKPCAKTSKPCTPPTKSPPRPSSTSSLIHIIWKAACCSSGACKTPPSFCTGPLMRASGAAG